MNMEAIKIMLGGRWLLIQEISEEPIKLMSQRAEKENSLSEVITMPLVGDVVIQEKKANVVKEKVCTICKKPYKPTCNVQKVCQKCKSGMKKSEEDEIETVGDPIEGPYSPF